MHQWIKSRANHEELRNDLVSICGCFMVNKLLPIMFYFKLFGQFVMFQFEFGFRIKFHILWIWKDYQVCVSEITLFDLLC